MGAESRPGQISRIGRPVFQQFKDGLPGNNGVLGSGTGERWGQQGRLLPSSIDSIEIGLNELLERQRSYAAGKGLYFNSSHYIYGQLLRRSSDLYAAIVPGGNVEEAKELAGKMALAVGILAYPKWRPQDQIRFRRTLHTDRYIQYCEAEQLQWKHDGFINWDRGEKHDHYIKLPEVGRQLLKRITNVVGIPYDPQQETFFFSTVLDQPEPIVPEE